MCIAYTGSLEETASCPVCNVSRYRPATEHSEHIRRGRHTRQQPRKQFVYLPLIERLQIQYRNGSRAHQLKTYRAGQYETFNGTRRDVFDGDLYRQYHVQELGLFQDRHDIALQLSCDGVQVTSMKNHEIFPVIVVNLNLPPDVRYLQKNILSSFVVPGPKAPKRIDTFLQPLVDELHQLDSGIDVVDGETLQTFTLRAWPILVTGDGPAIADVMGMKRPGNSQSPCRACHIQGRRSATSGNTTLYVPECRAPIRSRLCERLQDADLLTDENKKIHGVVRRPLLLELRSLHFPRSFPLDIMHAVLLNVVPLLWDIWIGSLPNIPAYLTGDDREAIGQSLTNARSDIPASLGHAPRNIHRHSKSFKAAEWKAWLLHYGVPLLHQRLESRCVKNFRLLKTIYSAATSWQVSGDDILKIEQLCGSFVQTYEECYFQQDDQRIHVCRINNHSLQHLGAYIKDLGPACYWWQFVMER